MCIRDRILQTYYRHDSNIADQRIGCYIPADDLAIESEKRFKIYADSIGADYKMISKPPFKRYPQPAWLGLLSYGKRIMMRSAM